MIMQIKKKNIILGLIPVILGGIIYMTYRADSLLMFKWFRNQVQINSLITFLRTNFTLQNLKIPNWAKYSLPDALWILSFTYLILLIWDFKINKQSIMWISFPPLIGLFSELGQLIHIIPGTFDITDLIFLIIAILAPFYYTTNLKSIKL